MSFRSFCEICPAWDGLLGDEEDEDGEELTGESRKAPSLLVLITRWEDVGEESRPKLRLQMKMVARLGARFINTYSCMPSIHIRIVFIFSHTAAMEKVSDSPPSNSLSISSVKFFKKCSLVACSDEGPSITTRMTACWTWYSGEAFFMTRSLSAILSADSALVAPSIASTFVFICTALVTSAVSEVEEADEVDDAPALTQVSSALALLLVLASFRLPWTLMLLPLLLLLPP
tara:strand:- start:90 stop:782 length:693 start_codon:yes stop_codon:yes gene_type:complete